MPTYYVYIAEDSISTGVEYSFVAKRELAPDLERRGWSRVDYTGETATNFLDFFNDHNLSGPSFTSGDINNLRYRDDGGGSTGFVLNTTDIDLPVDNLVKDEQEITIPGLEYMLAHPVIPTGIIYKYDFDIPYRSISLLSNDFETDPGTNWTVFNGSIVTDSPQGNVFNAYSNTGTSQHSYVRAENYLTFSDTKGYVINFKGRADGATPPTTAKVRLVLVDSSPSETVVTDWKDLNVSDSTYHDLSLTFPGDKITGGSGSYRLKFEFDISAGVDSQSSYFIDDINIYSVPITAPIYESMYRGFDIFEHQFGITYTLSDGTVSTTSDMIGSATGLDPNDSDLEAYIANSPELTYGYNFNITSLYSGTSEEVLFGYGVDNFGTANDCLLVTFNGSTNQLSIYLNNSEAITGISISRDVYNELYVTYDGSEINAYLNDNNVGTYVKVLSLSEGTSYWALGGQEGITYDFISLWNRALSLAEFKTYTSDIDLSHINQDITSSNTVHGIRQGTGNGFDADSVDGKNVDDAQSSTQVLWSGSRVIDEINARGVNKSWYETVKDKDLTSPPGSPSEGDRYIVNDAYSYAITGVNTTSNYFSISGDQTSNIATDDIIKVEGSTGNNGWYTVISAVYNSGTTSTDITVSSIVDATVDGNILISSGLWSDMGVDTVALYEGGVWVRSSDRIGFPQDGTIIYVLDEDKQYMFDGTNWNIQEYVYATPGTDLFIVGNTAGDGWDTKTVSEVKTLLDLDSSGDVTHNTVVATASMTTPELNVDYTDYDPQTVLPLGVTGRIVVLIGHSTLDDGVYVYNGMAWVSIITF